MERELVRRCEWYLPGTGTGRLFRRSWLPLEPSRTLVLVHGYGEHSGRYDHLGAWFAARAFGVHAFDQRGHGRSSGPRCHVRRFGEFLDDLERVLTQVRAEHPRLPLFLVGHSMGGLVVAAYALERRSAVSGVVTSGAALSIAERISPLRARGVRWLRRLAPRLPLDSGVDPEGLASDPEVARSYRADPLVQTRMSASFAIEFFDAARGLAGAGGRIGLPMLVLHGGDDPICSAQASAAFAQAVPDAELRIYPGMRHEIFNETGRERVFRDVLDWTCARTLGTHGVEA